MGMDYEVVSFPHSLNPQHTIAFENHGLVSRALEKLLSIQFDAKAIASSASKFFSHKKLPNTADLTYAKKLSTLLRKQHPELGSQSDALNALANALGYKNFASLSSAAPVKVETQKEREAKLLPVSLWVIHVLGLLETLKAEGIADAVKKAASAPMWRSIIPGTESNPVHFEIFANGTLVRLERYVAVAYPLSELGLVAVEYDLEKLPLPADAPSMQAYQAMTPEQQLMLFHAAWMHAPHNDAPSYSLEQQHTLIKNHHDASGLFAFKSKDMQTLYQSPYMLMSLSLDESFDVNCAPRFKLQGESKLFASSFSEDEDLVSQLLVKNIEDGLFRCEPVSLRQVDAFPPEALRMYLFSVPGLNEVLENVASISFKDSFYLKEEFEVLIEHIRPFLDYEGFSKLSEENLVRYFLRAARKNLPANG